MWKRTDPILHRTLRVLHGCRPHNCSIFASIKVEMWGGGVGTVYYLKECSGSVQEDENKLGARQRETHKWEEAIA